MSKTKRLSKPTRELQARLLRALNDGFVAPKEHSGAFYRLRDGKAIRKVSHLIIFQAMEDWDHRNGQPIPADQAPTPATIEFSFNPKVVQAAMLWAELTDGERDFVNAFVTLREGQKA